MFASIYCLEYNCDLIYKLAFLWQNAHIYTLLLFMLKENMTIIKGEHKTRKKKPLSNVCSYSHSISLIARWILTLKALSRPKGLM